MKREEVVSLTDLRRGVALKSQAGIGLRHAAAVVNDLQRRASGIGDEHADIAGTGIDSILHQLLDDRGGALYHLASGNLVGDGIGKELDDVHFLRFEI